MEADYLQDELDSSRDEFSDEDFSENYSESEEVPFSRYIDKSEVNFKLQQYIQDVQDETGLDRGVARVLLLENNWNHKIVIQNFRCGYIDSPKKSISNKTERCPICLSLPTNPILLYCNHSICKDCLQTILKMHLQAGSSILQAKCPEVYCDYPLDDLVFLKLLTDEEIEFYQNLLNKSFISCNKNLKKCKFEDCKFYTYVKNLDAKVYTCSCSREICIECSNEAHRPLSCAQFQYLSEKTKSIKVEFSKSCPACKSPLNFFAGLNVSLGYFCQCGYKFCIKCLKYLKDHNPVNCKEIYDDKFKIQFINDKLLIETDLGLQRQFIIDLFYIYYNHSKDLNSGVFERMSKISEYLENSTKLVKNLKGIYKGIALLYGYLHDLVFVPTRLKFLKFHIETVLEKLDEYKKTLIFLENNIKNFNDSQGSKNVTFQVETIVCYLESIYEMVEKDKLYDIKNLRYGEAY